MTQGSYTHNVYVDSEFPWLQSPLLCERSGKALRETVVGLQGAGYEGLLSCVLTHSDKACVDLQIKDLGAKAGVVLNPGTSLTTIEEVCFPLLASSPLRRLHLCRLVCPNGQKARSLHMHAN